MDPAGEAKRREIASFLRLKVASVRTIRVYTIDDELTASERNTLVTKLFVDPVSERLADKSDTFDWMIEVGYKPGVTDNVGKTTRDVAIPQVLRRTPCGGVYTATQYLISGEGLTQDDVERIGKELLANQVIESVRVFRGKEENGRETPFEIPSVRSVPDVPVKSYNLNVDDDKLLWISTNGVLSQP